MMNSNGVIIEFVIYKYKKRNEYTQHSILFKSEI